MIEASGRSSSTTSARKPAYPSVDRVDVLSMPPSWTAQSPLRTRYTVCGHLFSESS